ncbi:sigma-70 family RNA polymerase sigma factor [Sphingobacterium sp.]|uniref:RNA polymerase sigma factor n=1 Tax=Sphingobacterium sp. TaxID=341027 RepID=UPI0031E0F588
MSQPLYKETDEILYNYVRANNQKAYNILYDRYKRPLSAFALKKVSIEEAEDIVHDVLAKLWTNRDSIIIKEKLSAYVFRSLRNRILDHMARSDHYQRYRDSLVSFAEDQRSSFAADYSIREESFLNSVDAILLRHGPKSQTIIRMRMQGYNNHEIAEKLNLSEKTVRNQQSSILKYLRSKLPIFIFLWLIIILQVLLR